MEVITKVKEPITIRDFLVNLYLCFFFVFLPVGTILFLLLVSVENHPGGIAYTPAL